MSVEAFGAAARAYAAGIAGVEALVADATMPARALAGAVRRRRGAAPFLSGIVLDDERSLVAYEFAHQLLGLPVDEDRRRRLFDALANGGLTIEGKPQSALVAVDPLARSVLGDVAMMGQGLLVRSWAEAERVAGITGRRRDLTVRLPGVDASVPECEPPLAGDSIVVWAAGLRAHQTAMFAYALRDFFLPVIIACSETPAFPVRHVQYVAPDRRALERAAVAIDASPGSPATAIALARLGVGLAVTAASGAHEYLQGAVPYDAWNWRSIQAAAQRALASGPASLAGLPCPEDARAALSRAGDAVPNGGPLVSVAIPTYNRRELLARALDSIARQRYRDVEMIVVNDGGEPVNDVVARHPNATLIESANNLGVERATNVALRAARGQYVTFCCDDDMLFPDAIARWVGALERSGAKVVHGNTVMRFDRRSEGRAETLGYKLMWKDNVDHRDSIYTPFAPLSCVLFHREILERLGYYIETAAADTEFMIRMSRAYDFAHVDQPCAEIEYDPSKGQGPVAGFARRAESLERVFALYPTDSAEIAQLRRERLEWHRSRGAEGTYFEPDLALEHPEPAPSAPP